MARRVSTFGGLWVLPLLLLLLGSATAVAGTTGNLVGYVTDPSDNPLKDVKVTVVAPVLQGSKEVETDAQGFFRITQLPPGEGYKAVFEAKGYSSVEVRGIIIHIDETIRLPTRKLVPVIVAGGVEVVATTAQVDQATTTIGRTLTSDVLKVVPIGRTTTAALSMTPGASSDALGVTFRGATSPENSYVIDGLNTTSVVDGTATASLPPEFVQEIQVKTGGYEPEYGRATGGQSIVITRSGGNEFHGDIFAYVTPFYGHTRSVIYGGDSLATENQEAAIISKASPQIFGQLGFDLGGYIVKDRLWFFVGYAPTLNRTIVGHEVRQLTEEEENAGSSLDPDLGDDAIYDESVAVSHFYLANLLFNISQDHSLRVSVSGNPTLSSGALYRVRGDPGTYMATNTTGSMDYLLTYNGKFLQGLLNLDALVGYHTEVLDIMPFQGTYNSLSGNSPFDGTEVDGVNSPLVIHQVYNYDVPGTDGTCTGPDGSLGPCQIYRYQTGGLGWIEHQDAQRLVVKPVLSLFVNNLVGSHVFKLGGDLERNHLASRRGYPGGVAAIEYSSVYLEQIFANGDEPITWQGADNPDSYFSPETRTVNTSAFAQDNWNILPNLSLNLGLRWERQQILDVNGVARIDLNDNFAPRLGVIYDPTNQGKSKLFANFGRYYESVPEQINDRALAPEGTIFYVFDKASYPDYTPGGQDLSTETPYYVLGGEISAVQSDLKGQFSDQLLAGFEYELGANLSVGITGVYARLGNVIEDISPDDGETYLIANPGSDNFNYMEIPQDEEGNYLWDQASTPMTDENGDPIVFRRCIAAIDPLTGGPVTYCTPKASRQYRALEFTLNRRLADDWTAQASYTLSQTYGNYPGLFVASTGQLDPNISQAFDLANLMVNRDGYLDQDRRHNFRLAGAYRFKFGTWVGLNAQVESGAPISYLGAHPIYTNGNEAYMLPRGVYPEDAISDTSSSLYIAKRTPWIFDIDANVRHVIDFKDKKQLALGVQVNNVLNAQRALRVDQNYTYDTANPAAGTTRLSDTQCYDTSTGAALASCERNSNFGKATAYQAPFNVRFEAKFSF